MQFALSPCTGDQTFGSEDHDHHQHNPKDQVTNTAEGETRNEVGDRCVNGIQDIIQAVGWISYDCIELVENKQVDTVDYQCSNDHPWDTANATNNYHREVDHGVAKAKVIRRHCAQLGSM